MPSKDTQFKKGNQLAKGNQYAKGKKYAQKLKTPELKKDAYKQYCHWISQGKSKKAWTFKHPTLTLTWETMEKYIKNDPKNFDPLHKEVAESQSLEVWEERGLTMMLGQIEKCQPAIFQMFMRNKFGWDKEEHRIKESTEPLIKKLAQKWRERNE